MDHGLTNMTFNSKLLVSRGKKRRRKTLDCTAAQQQAGENLWLRFSVSLAKYETRSRNLTLASISRCVHNKTNKWVKAGFKPWWWCSLTYVRVLLLWPLSWPDDLFYLCFWLCLLSDAWTAARDYNIFAPKTAPPAFAALTFSWLSHHLKVNVQGA